MNRGTIGFRASNLYRKMRTLGICAAGLKPYPRAGCQLNRVKRQKPTGQKRPTCRNVVQWFFTVCSLMNIRSEAISLFLETLRDKATIAFALTQNQNPAPESRRAAG
jgi:hypothetical protein